MAVSKRLRFEILRRDNHTCRYCGAKAPDVALRVDHVIPEALGGPTEASNLVTACEPCNSGKSSVALDADMVEDIKADALRFAEITRQAYAVLAEQIEKRTQYEDAWFEKWTFTPIPQDWRNTLGRWHDMGVPIALILDAARIACAKSQTFQGDGRFKYFCGIVWKQVHTVTAEASVKMTLDGAWKTAKHLQRISEDSEIVGQFLAVHGTWLDERFKRKHEQELRKKYLDGFVAGAMSEADFESAVVGEPVTQRVCQAPRCSNDISHKRAGAKTCRPSCRNALSLALRNLDGANA